MPINFLATVGVMTFSSSISYPKSAGCQEIDCFPSGNAQNTNKTLKVAVLFHCCTGEAPKLKPLTDPVYLNRLSVNRMHEIPSFKNWLSYGYLPIRPLILKISKNNCSEIAFCYSEITKFA